MSEQDRARRNETIIILVASAIGVLVLLGAGLFGTVGLEEQHEEALKASCQSNLKQLTLAMLMYCSDWDEHWPMTHNWCDATYPYVKNASIYACPSLPDATWGYAYNARLDRVSLKKLKRPADTVALYDGLGGWSLAGGPELADPRHDEGLNVGFTDGHVKWVQDGQLGAYTWDPAAASGAGTSTPTTQP